jgi:hypothetical protein
VKSADAFHSDDATVAQDLRGVTERRVATLPHAADVSCDECRAALRTRNRLGVKPPVPRVGVFGLTGRTHLERRHRRTHTVIRQLPEDRESRPARRAGDERMTIPAIAGIE